MFTKAIISYSSTKSNANIAECSTFTGAPGHRFAVLHSLCMGIISVRAIYRSIYEQVFKVLEIEDLKMEREFLFVEKRGETAKLQQTFKRFITSGYNV